MKFTYKSLLILFLIPSVVFGINDKKKHEKSRTIKKEFKVNSDANLNIDNKFGDVKITTWNRNEITIEVEIIVEGNDLDEVEDRLESVDIKFESTANYVAAKTFLENNNNSWSFWKKKNRISFKINYTVKMPISNSLEVDNDYGGIYLDNLEGKASINCDYGKVYIDKLSAENNNINLDYCSTSNIGFMKSGNVNIDYSKLTIEDSEELDVNSDYSTVKVLKTDVITFNSDYGSVYIDEAISIDGNSDYASMRFGTIKKSLIINTDYGGLSVDKIEKGFDSVIIDGEYAGIKIGVDYNASFTFEMDLQYAGLSIDKDKVNYTKKISKNSKKYYEGTYGNGNAKSSIKIRSQFGGVSIRNK